MPNCNEFIFIWLYVGFVVYFWVQSAFLLTEDESYGYADPSAYKVMGAATITIALSLTITLIYLIFYSMSQRTHDALLKLDVGIKYLLAFTLLLTAEVAEYAYSPYKVGSVTLLEFYVYFTLGFALIVIILAQYFPNPMWYISFAYFAIIIIADLCLCTSASFDDFFIYFLIALSLIAVAGIFIFF